MNFKKTPELYKVKSGVKGHISLEDGFLPQVYRTYKQYTSRSMSEVSITPSYHSCTPRATLHLPTITVRMSAYLILVVIYIYRVVAPVMIDFGVTQEPNHPQTQILNHTLCCYTTIVLLPTLWRTSYHVTLCAMPDGDLAIPNRQVKLRSLYSLYKPSTRFQGRPDQGRLSSFVSR